MIKYFFLFIFSIFVCISADENINFLKKELLHLAKNEYEFNASGYKPEYQIECEKRYIEVLEFVNRIPEKIKQKNNKFYSRVYDRIAWFMFNDSNKLDEIQISDIFTKSLQLWDKNYIAYFKAYHFYQSRNIKLCREYLLRAYELKPTMPEVLIILTGYYSDKSKQFETAFIENRKNYIPELCHFDLCYPHSRYGVTMMDDNGKQFDVERFVKFKESDESRFELIDAE